MAKLSSTDIYGTLNVQGDTSVEGTIKIGETTPVTLSRDTSLQRLKVQTDEGFITIGSQNSFYAHFYTDRPTFYFGTDAEIAGNISGIGNLYLNKDNTPANADTFIYFGDDESDTAHFIQFDDSEQKFNFSNDILVNGVAIGGGGGGLTAYTSRLSSTVTISDEDTYETIMSITGIVPGKYLVFINGLYARSTGSTTRRLETSITLNDPADTTYVLNQHWTNAGRTSGGSSVVGYNLYNPNSTVGTEILFRSSASTTGISFTQFESHGMMEIGGSSNKTFSLHAKKVTTSGTPTVLETVSINQGTSIYLIKVA